MRRKKCVNIALATLVPVECALDVATLAYFTEEWARNGSLAYVDAKQPVLVICHKGQDVLANGSHRASFYHINGHTHMDAQYMEECPPYLTSALEKTLAQVRQQGVVSVDCLIRRLPQPEVYKVSSREL